MSSNIQNALKAYESRMKKKKDEEENKPQSNYESALKNFESRYISDVDEKYINTYIEDANKFNSSAQADYDGLNWGNASSTYKNRKTTYTDLTERESRIRAWLNSNKSKLDEETYNSLSDSLASISSGTKSVMDEFKKYKNYYSQQETEEDDEGMLNFNLDEGKNEIEGIKSQIAKSKSEYSAAKITIMENITALQAEQKTLELAVAKGHKESIEKYKENERKIKLSYTALNDAEAAIREQEAVLSSKQQYYTLAERAQSAVALTNEALNAPDFEKYSNIGNEAGEMPSNWDRLWGAKWNAVANLRNNPEALEAYETNAKSANGASWGTVERVLEGKVEYLAAKHMKDDEFKIYNYYYAKDVENGTNNADKYLESIEDTLNQRAALEKFDVLEGNVFLEMVFGVEAGLAQFEEGIVNLFSNEDYISPSSTQIASGMVREDLEDSGFKLPEWMGGASIGQVGYDLTTTTANMLPSILVSTIPVVGQVAGTTLLGASAAGNAKAEMLRLGYSKEQANTYGLLVGASEGVLQYALGGISALSGGKGGIFTSVANKFVDKVDKGLAKAAIKLGGNMLDEGLEEALQSILEPVFKSAVTLEDFEGIDWTEVVYSGLLGMATAGAFEGVGSATNLVANKALYNQQVKAHGQDIINKGGTDSLKALALDMAGVSQDKQGQKISNLAGKVESKASAKNVGKLSALMQDTISAQNKADIQSALVKKGLSSKEASKVAEYLAGTIELTADQKAEIEGNENIKSVIDELVNNSKSAISERARNLLYARLGAYTSSNTSSSDAISKVTKSGELKVKNDVDVTDKVSESGKTTRLSTGEEITINKNNAIAKVKIVDGETVVYLNTDHGVVESSDVSYANENEGLIYEAFVDMNPAFANAVIKNYDGSVPAQTYINGMREGIVLYGMNNFQAVGKDISKGSYLAELSEADQNFALKLGRAYAKADAKKAEAPLRKAIRNAEKRAASEESAPKKVKGGKVSFENGVKAKTKDQKRAVRLAKYLSNAIGIDIVFYDAMTTTDPNGKGSNGYFDETTNSIHLDLQNANNDSKTIAFTLSHEVVHFIKKWSPTKFNAFANFLMEQYAEHGVDASTLLSNKMAELGTTDADFAYEEMICDACETMLLDSNAMVKLMQLRQSDLELFEKLKMHILELLNKLREAYRSFGYESTTDEAKALLKMTDVLEKFHAMFEDAVVEATQNYQVAQTLNAESVSVSEDGTVRLQMKQYQQTGRTALLNYLREQYGNENANDLILTIDNIYDVMKEIKNDEALSVFGNWQDTEVELDENGHPIFTTSINNGDYELNQDFSRVCKKRRQLDFVLNMLAEDPAFEASHLTKQDFVKINKAIKAHGFEIACALCFVDSKRFRQAEWADSFANTWNDILNAVVKDSSKLTPFNFATKNPNLSDDGIEIDTSKAVTYRKWSDGKEDVKNRRTYESFEQILSKSDDGKWLEGNANVRTIATLIRDNPELRHTFRGADIIASQGFDTIQRLAPGIRGILDGWGGSSVPKPSSNDASYDSSIINMSGYNKETAYAMGGVRMNSFSDFMAHMFFDYCQAFADLAAKELPSQAYTKELIYVRLFGRSGQKINMSGIAAIRDDALPTTASKGVTKAEAEANEKIEKMVAGLDVSRLLEHLNKDIHQLTEADVEQFLDMCDYVWADESINMKHATLLQTGILYDKLTESKIEECYELLKAGEVEQALKVAGKDNVDTEYAKNCGTIVVGVSDAHIRKLLRDPTVRMVIPYHKSGLNPIIARELRISAYNDYTLTQTTGVKRKGSKTSDKIGSKAIKDAYGLKDFEFYDWFGKTIDGKLYDGKATADKYLEWCEKGYYDEKVGDYVYYTTKGDGYILAKDFHKKASIVPKFDAFMGEENYYKVLEDFDCYDTITGEHSAQGAVDFLRNGLTSDYKDVLVGALKEEQKVHDDFRDHLDNKGLKEEVMDIVKARGYEPSIKKQAKKKSSYEAIEDDVKKFATEINQWVRDEKPSGMTFILGSTGDVLQGLGAIESDIYILGDKINTILSEHPEISIADIKKIPQIVGDPVLILKSRNVGRKSKANSRLVIFGTVKASNGSHILSVLDLKPVEKGLVIDDMQKVNSVYTKTDPASFVSNSDVVYADKKRTTLLLRAIGFQMPIALQQSGYIGSISYSRDIVNIHGKTFSEVVTTNGIKKQLKKSSTYAPTFYSQMGKVIDDIKMDKIGATSIVNYLKGKGIKNDEIKWSGIEAWLEDKKSVTKAELQEFIAGSQLVIEEEMSGAESFEITKDGEDYIVKDKNGNVLETWVYNAPPTLYAGLVDGTWESSEGEYAASVREIESFAREEYGGGSRWGQYKLDGGTNYRELVFKMPDSSYSNRAMRGHWGQDAEGILVHARIQDFDVNGKKMLFIEELQSDWHNEGMEKGYTTEEYEDAVATYDSLAKDYANKRKAFNQYVRSSEFRSDPDDVSKKKFNWLRGKMDTAEKRMQEAERYIDSLKEKGMGDVADAPFRDTYHEYVLKRLLRMAAEEGYDSIGWTPADIQSKRWSYDYEKAYKIEYDQEMPKFLRKYGKKWGATVGKERVGGFDEKVDVDINTSPDDDVWLLADGVSFEGTEVWSMDITEPMEQSVLYEGQAKFQKKKLSNRTVLSNALESSIDTSTQEGQNELKWLKDYQAKIALIEKEEAHLAEVNAEIKEISFTKGSDRSKLSELHADKNRTANRITTYDKQLMRLEAMKPIKDVLAREKEMVRKRTEQKGKEAMAKLREREAEKTRILLNRASESRKKGIESRNKTEMRRKIRNIVAELNQLLIHPTKDKHVGLGLQQATADALSAVNMDTVRADSRLAKIKEEMSKTSNPDKIAELQSKYEHIEMQGFNIAEKLTSLNDAYRKIKESDNPLIANVYDQSIKDAIENLKDQIGDTSIMDMSLEQLEKVYDMYKMVLHTIRTANKTFKSKRKETIDTLGNRTMEEVEKVGGSKERRAKLIEGIKGFSWNALKPIYAMEFIGSETLAELYENVREGEDVWAVDISEAKDFFKAQAEKYGYEKWDKKKQYQFTAKRGKSFSLSVEQMMSLYAYSKRNQADLHLELGGFVFDEAIEITEKKHHIPVKYTVNTATAHAISKETLADIISKLTDEQRAFVDAMQDYLSSTMGAKGNEVSRALYDIELFKEKHYFPLKSAKQFMFEQNEVAGEVKIKNSGFSKETVARANNPIILSDFMDVWANHVNDMSMYHAFVLPLEDFNRVFNYKTPTSDKYNTESVKMTIQNAYGSQPVSYIRQLLSDLNGGTRVDSTADTINKRIGLFKKSAVFASASVVIQQPSAVARAMALMDAKYFVGKPSMDRHKETWAEVKKYAPVAIIKEMGYFDIGMGQSTIDWIKDEKTLKDKIDDVASKAPALADELSWCYIWKAVKREVSQTHKDLDPNSEAFLKAVGERFTEVVTKTQVYDSVLSRSAMMRSKDTGMKMLTAFMAEPTTSLNMLASAILQGKRGNKRYTGKVIGAVVASMILNSILVSLVYAGRDDDEDETYVEKYLSTLTEELRDSLNPLTLIPFVKDIVSIKQGYDIERSDMAVITDIIKAWDNLDSDNRSAYRKVEDFAGAIASIFGLPVKNVMRDARGLYNTVNSFINGDKTTGAGIGNAIKESVTGKETSDSQQLYEAIISGDSTQIKRVEGRFKDQKAIDSAIRKALRENDSRIKEAAEALYEEDVSEYSRIIEEFEREGNFDIANVKAAIDTELDDLKGDTDEDDEGEDKVVSAYDTEHYYLAIANGDTATANEVKDDLIDTAIANGKSQKDAEKSVVSGFCSACRKAYVKGDITRNKAMDMLVKYGGLDSNDAYWELKEWDYISENGSDDGYSKYNSFYDAVQTGKNLKAVISEYTSHGVTNETLGKQITSYFKPLYKEMSNSERAGIKGYLLNAYEQLGYKRTEKIKDINKWLEDD